MKGYGNLKSIGCLHEKLSSVIKIMVTCAGFNHLIRVCKACKAPDHCFFRGLIKRFYNTTNIFHCPLVKIMITLTEILDADQGWVHFWSNLMKYYPNFKWEMLKHVELFGSPTKRWAVKSKSVQYSLIKEALDGPLDDIFHKQILCLFMAHLIDRMGKIF